MNQSRIVISHLLDTNSGWIMPYGTGELLKTAKSMINWEEQAVVDAGAKQRNRKELPIMVAGGFGKVEPV